MTSYLLALTKAVASGRKVPPPADTRERLLVALLHKRATARNAGAEDMEFLLRSQIRWSLPTFHPEDASETPEKICA